MRFRFSSPSFCHVFCLAAWVAFCLAGNPAFSAEADDTRTNHVNWPTHLRFLSGPNGGQWFMLGDPISQALTKNVVPTVPRTGGGLSNIADIDKKRGDFGFSLACMLAASVSDEETYKSMQSKNVVLMNNVYPQVLYFLLRKDFTDKYHITSVESLLALEMPLRFASLKSGTASEFILSMLLKYGYNMDFDKLRAQGWSLSFSNYAETADSFVAGQIDCFAYTAGTDVPLIQVMEKHTDMVVLPVEQHALDILTAKFGTKTYTIPVGIYKTVSTPTKTLGDHACIVIRKDLPDDLVFAISKALWESRDSIAKVITDFGNLSPETALLPDLPIHPGAEKFWKSMSSK